MTGQFFDFRYQTFDVSDEIAHLQKEGEYGIQSRQPVLDFRIYAPPDAPEWMGDIANLQRLVNAAELAEGARRNAQVAERGNIALAHELTLQQNIWAAQDHLRKFVREGRIVIAAIHGSEPGEDPRNIHLHFVAFTRPVTPEGFAPTKYREQNARFMGRHQYVEGLREDWARTLNRHLARHGVIERVDHRSYKRQGIDREPTRHLGWRDWHAEKLGLATDRGALNRARQARNAGRERQRRAPSDEPDPPPPPPPAAPTQKPPESERERAQVRGFWAEVGIPSLQDIARGMNTDYSNAVEAAQRAEKLLNSFRGKREYWLKQAESAKQQIAARRAQMGLARKALDWLARPRGIERLPALGRDIALWKGEQALGKAAYLAQRAGIKEIAARDLLGARVRRRVDLWEQVRPAAEQRRAELIEYARTQQQEWRQAQERRRDLVQTRGRGV